MSFPFPFTYIHVHVFLAEAKIAIKLALHNHVYCINYNYYYCYSGVQEFSTIKFNIITFYVNSYSKVWADTREHLLYKQLQKIILTAMNFLIKNIS